MRISPRSNEGITCHIFRQKNPKNFKKRVDFPDNCPLIRHMFWKELILTANVALAAPAMPAEKAELVKADSVPVEQVQAPQKSLSAKQETEAGFSPLGIYSIDLNTEFPHKKNQYESPVILIYVHDSVLPDPDGELRLWVQYPMPPPQTVVRSVPGRGGERCALTVSSSLVLWQDNVPMNDILNAQTLAALNKATSDHTPIRPESPHTHTKGNCKNIVKNSFNMSCSEKRVFKTGFYR